MSQFLAIGVFQENHSNIFYKLLRGRFAHSGKITRNLSKLKSKEIFDDSQDFRHNREWSRLKIHTLLIFIALGLFLVL